MEITKRLLQSMGHEVYDVSDPSKVPEDCSQFQLLVTDYRIGGVSGLDLIDRLKGFSGKVVMMSGFFETDGIELSSSVDVYLRKPFTLAALREALMNAMHGELN